MTDKPIIQISFIRKMTDPATGEEVDAFQATVPTGETFLLLIVPRERTFSLELIRRGKTSGTTIFDIPDLDDEDNLVREFISPDSPARSVSDRITVEDFAALVEFVRHYSKGAPTDEPEL